MSVPEHRSRYFNDRFSSSGEGAIVTVNAGDRTAEAERILRDDGAYLGDDSASYVGTSNNGNDTEDSVEGL